MTHDELLEKITEGDDNINFYALRAVVKLHKPEGIYSWPHQGKPLKFERDISRDPTWGVQGPVGLGCRNCDSTYPCPTIEAIEKELK